MALGSTQPLKKMSTRNIFWGKGGRCVRLTTLPPSCAVVMKSGNLNFVEPSGPLQACRGLLYLYLLLHWHRSTRWRIWLSHCARSRKVAGSIHDGVIEMFHWHNPSGLEVDSSSNRNEYQEYFLSGTGGRCIGLTTLLPSCAVCHEIWESQPPGTLRACPGLYRDRCSVYYTDICLEILSRNNHTISKSGPNVCSCEQEDHQFWGLRKSLFLPTILSDYSQAFL